jgi:hypothetical protein
MGPPGATRGRRRGVRIGEVARRRNQNPAFADGATIAQSLGTGWNHSGDAVDEHHKPATPTGFERIATSVWRSVRRFLPASVAESIRVPVKRALRAMGLIRNV